MGLIDETYCREMGYKMSHSPALPLHGLEAQAMCHFNQKDVLLDTPQKL